MHMTIGRIVLLTGAPGTGKSTIARRLAFASDLEKSVHMHTDDFYHALCKGAIPPHLPASHAQNEIVISAIVAAAHSYVRGDYEVIVDGIVGPWFLGPWEILAKEGAEIHYVVLRADKQETLRRATTRAKLDKAINMELVETMWTQFQELGQYENHVVDTSDQSIEETLSTVRSAILKGTHRLLT